MDNLRRYSTLSLVCLCLGLASSLSASTIAPPRDLGHLASIADAVAFAEAGESWAEDGPLFPYTATRFYLLRQIAGPKIGATFEVREPGGAVEGRVVAIGGAPRYQEGRRYLLFLDRAPAGGWRSQMLSYGLLEEVEGADLLRPLAKAPELEVLKRPGVEPVGVYRKARLLDHLAEVARGARWDRRQAGIAEEAAATTEDGAGPRAVFDESHTEPAACDFLRIPSGTGTPFRWFGFETGANTAVVYATTPGQTGLADGGAGAVQQAVAAWTNHPDSIIRFQYGGTRAANIACNAGTRDRDPGGVVFNDPCGDITDLSNCSGTLAYGGIGSGGFLQTYDGESWYSSGSPYSVVNNGAGCIGATAFAEMMTHELGHSLGFGHHSTATYPNNPTMSAVLKNDGRGAALVAADKTCASYAYHTFLDVPPSYWSWRSIEAAENAGITQGCGTPGSYCPQATVSRAEMAVFLVRGIHGTAFVPPAAGGIFSDVPASHWAARHIEQLYDDGVTSGCGLGLYCPGSTVLRDQMAVFLVRARHGSGFVPPPATGTIFGDVPASYWAAPYIEQLFNDGITTGCSSSPRRYCPSSTVRRDEMAVFLARTFSLPLP